MVNFRTGNLYSEENYDKYDFIGFTANSVVNSKGCLVMGAGNAKVVRDSFEGIDKRLGTSIENLSEYFIKKDRETKIFALQTKIDWKDKSPMQLVNKSVKCLKSLALQKPDKNFAIPYPAINRGGLSKDAIEPLLKELPNNVTVYEVS